ncbi:MAG: Gfo/Idh/MocA family protein [Anaerolineales bacterium]
MTVRIGILGTGWGTRIQAPCFRLAGMEITALGARTPEKAARVAHELDIPFYSADHRRVIERADVDLVSITTPPYLHAEAAVAALEAGKHVLCEKPTALNAAEAEAMYAAARARPDQLALIDHELRFLPLRQRMREMIAGGAVGRLLHVETGWTSSSRLEPARPWTWWSDQAAGGGILGALGSHLIDTLTWLLDLPVTRVNADLRTFVTPRRDVEGKTRPVTADDYCTMQLRFGDDVSGVAVMSTVTPGPDRHHVTVTGAEGALQLDGEYLYRLGPGGSEPELVGGPDDIALPQGVTAGEFARGTVALGRALQRVLGEGDTAALAPAADFEQGLHLQQVVDAARASSATGAGVSLV